MVYLVPVKLDLMLSDEVIIHVNARVSGFWPEARALWLLGALTQ